MSSYRALPNGNILVHVPFKLVKNGGGTRLYATEPGGSLDRNLDLPRIQMVARGIKYRHMAATDEYPSRFKLAKHLGFDSSYLTRVIRLGYLSPVIVDKIARGELAHVTVERLQRIQSPIWTEQHRELGIEHP